MSAAESDGCEEGVDDQPAKDEGADTGVVSVASLQEEEGQEQGGGQEDSGKQGGQKSEKFLEAEKKPGAIDVKNPKPFQLKRGGRQQAAQEDDGGQQRVALERGPVPAQMLPGKNSPHYPESYDMVDIDPFHSVSGDGKKEVIQAVAYYWNGGDDIFGDQTGRGAGAVCPQDVAGKEKEQGHGERGGQPDPLSLVITPRTFKDGPEVDNGEEKEELAGIEMERAEIIAKRNKQIERAGRIERRGRIILEGHKYAGEHGDKKRDQAPFTPFYLSRLFY